jgi:hypothetical protein
VAEVQPQTLVKAGTKPTFGNSAAGDAAKCGPGYFVIVKNTSGGAINFGITVPGNNEYGEPNPDPTWSVPATTGEVWVPLLDAYRDPSDNLAHFTYSVTGASVTRAVVKR